MLFDKFLQSFNLWQGSLHLIGEIDLNRWMELLLKIRKYSKHIVRSLIVKVAHYDIRFDPFSHIQKKSEDS